MIRSTLRSRRRGTIAGATVLLVAAGFITIGAQPAMAASGRSDSPSAGDVESAVTIAAKFNHAVVVDAMTTPTTRVSALPDGFMQLESSTLPIRVKQGSGWVDVDRTLVASVEGMFAPKAASSPVRFSAGGNGPLASVQTATGAWLSEAWPYDALPAPVVSGSDAIYKDVLPGVDLRLSATAAGMSEVLVIRTQQAAQNPKLATVDLSLTGATVALDSMNSTRARAADGSTAVSSAPTWWDSSVKGSGADGPTGDGGLRPVTHAASGSTVSLNVGAIAATPNLTYPVYVDPDWSVGAQAYWFTDQAYPNQSYLNGQQADGIQSVGAGGGYLSRAFWEFGTAPLAGKIVQAAQFSATEVWSNTCTGKDIQAWRYGNATPGFTWNTDPGQWNTLQDTKNLSAGSSCSGASAVGFNVANAATWAASTSSGTLQIGLRAANEADQLTRRHFAQGATLTVTYNSNPGTPNGLKYSSPVRNCSTDSANPTSIDATQPITLQATASDPDAGQNLQTTFTVAGITQTSFSWSSSTPRAAPGAQSVTLPANALAIGDYRWHAQTNDGAGGVSPNSPDCYLRAVTASPTLPTVTKTSTGTATVGAPMTVQFGGAASDGVKVFAYWWTVGTPTMPTSTPVLTPITPGQPLPACGSASGPVRFACPASGSLKTSDMTVAPVDTLSTLWVVSYNDAGRPSLASNGLFVAVGLPVTAAADTTHVSTAAGHIWDSQTITTAATAVPDLNTTTGSDGTTTRQQLGAPLSLTSKAFFGLPTTVLNFTPSSQASQSERTAIDTKSSFTVSTWIFPSTTSASGVEHVAVSESSGSSTAFTLGTDTSGAAKFCRTSQIDQARICVTGAVIAKGKWTLLTGVWDTTNQVIRLLINNSITPNAVAAQPVPASDTSPNGWLGVGGSVSLVSGEFTTTLPWDGQIFRSAVFPGVVSTTQLNNLYNVLSPNDDPPADQSIGTVINLSCSQLITAQQMYNYDPNLSGLVSWTPATGTAAYKAEHWNGLGCQWVRESGGVSMIVSVASIVDRGTLVQLQTAAQAGTPVAGLGDSAFYSNSQLQIFRGGYWLVLQYPWTGSADDFAPLAQEALSALP